jgi:hypothetical protein
MKDQRGKTGKMEHQDQPEPQGAPVVWDLRARPGLDSRVSRARRELSALWVRLVRLAPKGCLENEDLEVPEVKPVRWAIPVRSVFPGPRVRRDRPAPPSSAHPDSPESR